MSEQATGAAVAVPADQGSGVVAEQPYDGFLAHYGITRTATGLVLPEDMPWDTYQEVVRLLGVVASAVPWYVGDAVLQGERIYGERYAQAMEDFGLAYQTLANYTSVCRSVAPEVRDERLSHGHHAAVANLKKKNKQGDLVPDEKAQRYWLGEAVKRNLSRAQLRQAIADSTKPGDGGAAEPAEPTGPTVVDEPQAAAPQQEETDWSRLTNPDVQHVLKVVQDVWDSAMPATTVVDATGYWAVPEDAMAEVAELLGVELPQAAPEPAAVLAGNGEAAGAPPPMPPPTAQAPAATEEDDAIGLVAAAQQASGGQVFDGF